MTPTSPGRICWQRKRKPTSAPTTAGTHPDEPAADLWSAGEQITLPPDVQALLAEKDRLESELKRLSGFGEPRPRGRARQADVPGEGTHQGFAHRGTPPAQARRSPAVAQATRIGGEALHEPATSADRPNWQPNAVVERSNGHSPGFAPRCAARKPRPSGIAEHRERAQAAVREQARQAEYAAEQKRKALETAAVQRRWEQDRRKALHNTAQERRQEALWQEQVLDEQRARAIQLARARRAEEQADLAQRSGESAVGPQQHARGGGQACRSDRSDGEALLAVG